ncbi:hypothetical protein [Streptomyces sp. NPDC055006]
MIHRELVGPGGDGADPFHGGVGGQPRAGHAGALGVPVEGAGQQLLAGFKFFDDGVAQAAKNLVMDFEGAGCRTRHMIRGRDGKFPALFDAVLEEADIEVVLMGPGCPA